MKLALIVIVIASTAIGQDQQPSLSLDTALNIQESDPSYAIELYHEVIEQSHLDSDRSLAAFNRGVLLLGQDEPGEAAESFRLAGSTATSMPQRRDAIFNLGHSIMSGIDMSGQMSMDPEKIGETIDQLRGAERAFLDSSRADASHSASKKNLERVRMQIRDLQNMKEQIEEQQSQDQENQQGEGQDGEPQDMAKELQDLADQQREQAQESETAPQNEQQSEQQQRSEDQENLSDQTQQAQESMKNAQDAKDQQETLDDIQEAIKAQQEAQEALENGDNEKAAQKQQEAADALDRAAQRIRESQEESESQKEGNGQSGQPQDQTDDPEEQEIDEVAQQLLDKERDERKRRQAYRATGRPVKVEKDW